MAVRNCSFTDIVATGTTGVVLCIDRFGSYGPSELQLDLTGTTFSGALLGYRGGVAQNGAHGGGVRCGLQARGPNTLENAGRLHAWLLLAGLKPTT